jgi:hypothetical protein
MADAMHQHTRSYAPAVGGEEPLEALIARFAKGGYAPSGADIPDDDPHGSHEHGDGGSVRRFDYRGHAVEIVTRYEVTIDGAPWQQPIHVQKDGTVMYHGLPQYVVPSAVELIQGVIDHSYEAPAGIRDAIQAARAEGAADEHDAPGDDHEHHAHHHEHQES